MLPTLRLVVLALFGLTLVSPIYASPMLPAPMAPLRQDMGEIPYLEWDDCPFLVPNIEIEGDTLECGYLITLENPFDADSELIEVAFAVLYSHSDNPALDPVVYLEGGPGGSALAGIDSWLEDPIRDRRDIVLIDQRGTGFSLPSLNCEEEEEYDEEDDDDYDPAFACYERLVAEGIDLAQYHTVNNAYDVADLIELLADELDYTAANLLGISYGTRLALAVMRDHPQVVRSVIIDSVYPPNVNAYEEQAANTQRAFDVLFSRCAADAACNAAYPNLETVFYETVNQLNARPAVFTAYDDWEEEDIEIEMTGIDLINSLFEALYDASLIPVLPAVIYYVAEGDYTEAYDLISYGSPDMEYEDYEDYYWEYDEDELDEFFFELDSLGDAEGMFYVLECQDEIAYNDYDRAVALLDGLRPEIAEAAMVDLEVSFGGCEYWLVEPAPIVENQAVVSDIPTLILTGEFDPITPPSWGLVAAQTLRNSFYFEFAGLGHGAIDDACALSIALQFLDNPTMEPSAVCMAGMRVVFYLR